MNLLGMASNDPSDEDHAAPQKPERENKRRRTTELTLEASNDNVGKCERARDAVRYLGLSKRSW